MMASDFLEPERLRAFVTVAETGNFTRAAERLHLTQPAITVQVRRLEESVGKALFERNSQFARLTKDGEVMLGYARELLEVIDRARRQFAQPPLEGSVRFGMVEDFGTTALPAPRADLPPARLRGRLQAPRTAGPRAPTSPRCAARPAISAPIRAAYPPTAAPTPRTASRAAARRAGPKWRPSTAAARTIVRTATFAAATTTSRR